MLEPWNIVRAPVAHDKCHSSIKRTSHITEVSVIYLRDISVVTLRKGKCVVATSEFNLDMEWASSINLLAWPEDAFLLEISDCVATSVTVGVMWSSSITSVSSCPERVCVGLHNVHLVAPLSRDVVCIAVIVAVSVIWLSIGSNSWELDGVEGCNATASHST